MIFVYVIQSDLDGTRYVGLTNNLDRRLKEHNQGKMKYTKAFRPWVIVYHETLPDYPQARKREKYFKSGGGRRWLEHFLNSKDE